MSSQENPSFSPQTRSSTAGRVWTFIRILNVRLRFIFLMVIVGVVVGYWEHITNYYDRWRRPVQASQPGQAADIEYFCPMHPSVVRSEPGSCPICGMPLSKRDKTDRAALPEGVLARVQLTPLKVQMGRIETAPVEYRQLSREIRAVGIVDYDESRRAFVSARIKGRLDKLMVNYVGQDVEKDDPLASIYSPDLLVAQEELLAAVRTQAGQQAAGELAAAVGRSLVEAARRKLLLWGITPEQIEEIIRRGTPETHLIIHSPIAGIVTEKKILEGRYVNEGDDLYTIADLSHVWLQAQVFEDQIAGIGVGTAVEVRSTAYPEDLFAGRINFVSYVVDPQTRTVSTRVDVDNADYKLKPGMYVQAFIRLPVGQVMEITPTTGPTGTERQIDTTALASAYLRLVSAYAQDKADSQAAADFLSQARSLAESAEPERRSAVGLIRNYAESLPKADLKSQRETLKPLSSALIDFVKAHPPAGRALYVVHCPMVDADWLSTTDEVANPYYGSEMLRCGAVTGRLKRDALRDEERFATGYFCPIYPEQLFDEPRHCPVDQFAMKLVRVDKVLAVPESSVVNTGKRSVVYRESDPGTFEMIEVQLGPRAGGFYPVLAGLNSGDRVANQGAFLVDAENRLNPAAAAQYFGASGQKP